MSDLIVVGFPKVQEAEEVRMELFTIQQEHLISLEDAVVLEHGEDDCISDRPSTWLPQVLSVAASGACWWDFCSSTHLWVQL